MKEYLVWLAKLLTIVVIIVFIIPFFLLTAMSATDKAIEEVAPITDKKTVAVIEVRGVISDAKEILEDLYKQAASDKVKGIVLRVDSPGGAVGPSQEIFSAVKALKSRKPIVASMGAVAASGGLYVSLGASRILAQPGTITGSIGVIMQLPNFTKIANQIGVDFITIKSGKLKDAGNTFRPMTDEEREFLQNTILKAHEDFVLAVQEGRNLAHEKVVSFADGRVILGSQAKELGLIDGYGDLYDAARAVFEILGEPLSEKETPKLYYPGGKFERIRKVLESLSSVGELFSRKASLQYIML